MQLFEDRHALHRIPELSKELPRTVAYVTGALGGLSCRVFSPVESAVGAWFDLGADSASAFRADMDALPVTERTGLPYASEHLGCMHACGHDGHTAVLLELARRLDRKKTMKKNVLLVFQPAEETTGGAKELCDTGIFETHHVEAIFGLHLWPGLTPGVIHSRRKELMSRSSELTVDITGRAAHIAKAAQGLDALAAGVEFYTRAVEMEKAIPPEVFRLLKFGRMESGTVRNAISAHTRLEGSLRAFQDDVFEAMREKLYEIGREVEKTTGCSVSVRLNEGYPAVMNPDALYDRVCDLVEVRQLSEPSMTSEDFSYYQKRLPGVFFFLGVGDTPALHADNFDFDETILVKGADFFEELAEKFQ